MQNSFIVRGLNTCADLPEQTMGALNRDGSLSAEELIQRFAFDVFHYQKKNAFIALAKVSDVDDVRMLNRCGGPRLALETRNGFAFLQVFV